MTIKVILFHQPVFLRQIVHFRKQINDFNYVNQTIPFYSEAIMHMLRIGLTVTYFILINNEINAHEDKELLSHWNRAFLPVRISALLMVGTFVLPLILKIGFGIAYPEYILIVPAMILATFMFFWHILVSIRDLETVVVIQEPEVELVTETQKQPELDVLSKLPENLLAAIKEIHLEQLYLNPLFGVSDIALKHGFDSQKFSVEFNKHLPFSFTSYVNYLRLVYHKANFNEKFSVEANILGAGFNSRASYYQWVKRREKLETILPAYVEAIAAKTEL